MTENQIIAEKDGSFTINVGQIKDLTNKEIDELIMYVPEKPTDEDLYDFAIAILKKARE
jgi:hypothetical protein